MVIFKPQPSRISLAPSSSLPLLLLLPTAATRFLLSASTSFRISPTRRVSSWLSPSTARRISVQPGRPIEATQLVVQPGQVVQRDRHRRVHVMSSIQPCIIAIGTRRPASHSPSPAARSSCRTWTTPATDEAWAPSPGPSCHTAEQVT